MKEIRFWYNRNRKLIWRIIGIIAVVIILVKLMESILSKEREDELIRIQSLKTNTETNYNAITLDDNKSTVTGEKIKDTKLLSTIDEFIDYCNNNKINEAYNLLSEDCKKELYPTVDKFRENYYNKIFSGTRKNILVENWVNNIYKVKFIEDALSTGKYSTENTIQDYITIIKDENKNVKLNINGYIGKKEIGKQKEDKDILVKVLEKHQYMNFETYTFEITNNSNNIILLNETNSLETMYLEDKNNIKYSAYTHEKAEAELKLLSRETKIVTIKYYNKYSSNKKIENVVFSRIILNYNAYINYQKQNIAYYTDYGVVEINL